MLPAVIRPDTTSFFAHPDGVIVDVLCGGHRVRVVFPNESSEGLGKTIESETAPTEIERAVAAAGEVLRGGLMETRRRELFEQVRALRSETQNP